MIDQIYSYREMCDIENVQTLQRGMNFRMNPTCAKCAVRYFCGGGCRGENYQVTRKLRSPHFNCEEIRNTILEMMWMLTEEPTFFQNKVEGLYQTVCF